MAWLLILAIKMYQLLEVVNLEMAMLKTMSTKLREEKRREVGIQ